VFTTCKGLGEFPRPLPFLRAVLALACVLLPPAMQGSASSRRITWDDLAPLHPYLKTRDLTAGSFGAFVDRTHADNERRVREGDLDHLVFYLLQSTDWTKLPPIEPALSARALVSGMDEPTRAAFLRGDRVSTNLVASPVGARIDRGLSALDGDARDARRTYFRDLVRSVFPSRADRGTGVRREYLRAMRFVYEKEFVAQRAERPADAVAELYRTRGLSTDTAVEAGFVVREGLGIVAGLDSAKRIRRVLVVGPGLDLAPRTGFIESSPPQSYQPWAVMDALVALKLSAPGELQIVGADINPRVVAQLRSYRESPPTLGLTTEIRDDDGVTLRPDYREYFTHLGAAVGTAGVVETRDGRLTKTVRVTASNAQLLDSERIDIVTERLIGPRFDLIIATNILPYFDDTQLALALTNIAAMLAPGGILLHNERRPVIGDLTAALGVPFEQSRHVTIADVRGAPPLFDSVFLHRKVAQGSRLMAQGKAF
jgi:hypothetical protein